MQRFLLTILTGGFPLVVSSVGFAKAQETTGDTTNPSQKRDLRI